MTQTQTLPRAQHANIHFVTPQLAVGGDLHYNDDALAARQLTEIRALGISHIVDVRVEWSDLDVFAEHASHIDYLHHGMDDAGQAVPAAWFERAVRWVEAAYAGSPNAVVLTHCHMGINRGPSLGFAILLAQGGKPVEAIAAIRAARPQANVWYAADALDWHHARTGVGMELAIAQHVALATWREENPLDVVRLIREQRERGL